MKTNEIYECQWCEKELSEEKGELAHGCLDCSFSVPVDKLRLAYEKIEKLKRLLLLTDPSVSNIVVGDTQIRQHQSFLDAFPEERHLLEQTKGGVR